MAATNINSLPDPPNLVPTTPQQVLAQLDLFLQDFIQQLAPALSATGPGRPRVLPALALWAGLLVCVLRGFSSQLALWRLLTQTNLWFFPRFDLSVQASYKRLDETTLQPLQPLFAQISLVLKQRLDPFLKTDLAPFATEVYALDATTLDQTARYLPHLRGAKAGSSDLLPGQLAALFDLRRQQWRRLDYSPDPHQNCKVVARDMLENLPQASLLLADLGYFGFKWFDDLTRAKWWWVSRLRSKISYVPIHVYYQQADTLDMLVWLGAHRADRVAFAVRLVQFKVGGTLHTYLTNVLDPSVLPPLELARLYARRWDIELAFKTIKPHLGLHLLWSAKPNVILLQVWAVLIISQILPALQMEVAYRAGVDVFDVSLALLIEYMPQYAYTGIDPVALFVERGRAARFIRPSSRTHIDGPVLEASQIVPAPPDLVLEREARYARRRADDRYA
jgi:hypothetical protein